jgi:tRNA nucleotidyltransferase (CCA-adding enzyme)
MKYAERLTAALEPADRAAIDLIAQAAQQQHVAIYLVGGPVRDCLLTGRITGGDFDLTVEGEAVAVARAAAAVLGGALTVHARFGTANIRLSDGRSFDLAMTRTETYARPGALPDVTPGTLETDLVRRDFTINAMALRLDGGHFGELIDRYGGETDLQRGVIRVLHDRSFIDDPTRLFRAARFEQRFRFQLEAHTRDLIPGALPVIDHVSGDRLRHELELIFQEAQPVEALRRLQAWGVLRQIDAALDQLNDLNNAAAPGGPFGWWARWLWRLPADDLDRVAERLNLPGDEARDLKQLHNLAGRVSAIGTAQRPSVVYRLLSPFSERAIVTAADLIDDEIARKQIGQYLSDWRHAAPPIDGRRLQVLGMPPGPALGRLLAALRDAALDGEVSSAAEAEALARRWLARELQTHVDAET